MILFEKALEIVENSAYILETETVDILQSLKRVLNQDITSDMNMPPFDKSAVDGFACRKQDLANHLEIIEVIQAGSVPQKPIQPNTCAKIMTGAMVPAGADCVIMVEYVETIDKQTIKFTLNETNVNICYEGEDIKQNDVVVPKGTLIKPQHIAVLATVGCTKLLVYKMPRIAIISTGNELVEPWQKPEISQIRNSNAYQLCAQAINIGLEPNYIGIAPDTEEGTKETLQKAMVENDIILLTGGVSMGDFDLVPKVLSELGFTTHFHHIAIQPGKPTLFASLNNKYCFGLPGNPVSSFFQFELLVKPLIYKMLGKKIAPTIVSAKFGTDFKRKKTERLTVMPVKLVQSDMVKPIDFHGSAHINSLNDADGVIFVAIGKSEIKKGETVDVRLF